MRGPQPSKRSTISNIWALWAESLLLKASLSAFSLGEMMTDDMALIHLEKAKTEFEGSYTVINNEFVKHEFAGAKWINREEDMGLPSLRKAKTSYRPVFLNEAKGAKYVGK